MCWFDMMHHTTSTTHVSFADENIPKSVTTYRVNHVAKKQISTNYSIRKGNI